MNTIKAGIIGAAGYTGGEMIRILLNHPDVEIDFCFSRSQSGKYIYEVHTDLFGETELKFSQHVNKDADVVFLCVPHGQSEVFLKSNPFSEATKVIDLSNAFRLKKNANGFVYGLPELNRNEIRKATRIANPGCFATAIALSLLPLAQNSFLKNEIHVSGITGSTGAGVGLNETSHFTWRNNNIAVYKAFTHQHLDEINECLEQLFLSYSKKISFIPYRGDFTRGIMTTAYVDFDGSLADAKAAYRSFYDDAAFTFLSEENVHLKQIVNTNKCLLYLEKADNKLMIISVLDNLLKGASGQAVQNMNLMFGLPETTALKLKPVAY
jgi:N-acetyl-gamma-glutamyl-phosphate reductase